MVGGQRRERCRRAHRPQAPSEVLFDGVVGERHHFARARWLALLQDAGQFPAEDAANERQRLGRDRRARTALGAERAPDRRVKGDERSFAPAVDATVHDWLGSVVGQQLEEEGGGHQRGLETLVVEGEQHPGQELEDPLVGDVIGGNRVDDFDDGVAGVDSRVRGSKGGEALSVLVIAAPTQEPLEVVGGYDSYGDPYWKLKPACQTSAASPEASTNPFASTSTSP